MKFWRNLKGQPWANTAIAACIAVLFYVLITHLEIFVVALSAVYSWTRPVILGVVIAYVLDPFAKWLERVPLSKIRKGNLRRVIATALTVISVLFLIVFLMALLIPQLIDSVATFVSNFGSYSQSLQGLLRQLEQRAAGGPIDLDDMFVRIEDVLGSLTTLITDNIGSIGGVATSIGSSVVDAVLAFIVAIYFLAAKHRMKAMISRFLHLILSDARYERASGYWKRCNEIFIRFIAYDLLDALIVGVVNSIFMLIAGIPYSVLISVIVGVTNLAPTFGPVVGAILGGLILVLVNPWYALWFLIFTIVLQIIDGYVIKPKLFGGSLGVPAVWILVTLIIGGRMFGVPGILLAIPVAAIIMLICQELFPQLFASAEQRQDPPDAA
ncbi:MAG: AI-2E family transporter [Lachnospiraceae bacterium]|nr:AI-2E family transporter [Lachnospiraceae bacterium]